MKWMRNPPHFSIYHKLVLTFLVIVMPLYGLGIMINESGANAYKEEISKSMQSKVHFYLSSLELEFSKTINLLQQYTADEDLEKLSMMSQIMSEMEKKNSIISLQKRLLLLRDSNSYIHNVSAYIPQIEKVITSNELFQEFPRDKWSAFQSLSDLDSSPFLSYEGRLYINLVYPDLLVMENRPSNYVLSIEIAVDALRNMLRQFIVEEQGDVVIIGDKLDWSISSPRNPALAEQFKQLVKNNKAEGIKKGNLSLDNGKQNNMVSFEKSDTLGITLLMSVPEKEVLQPLKQFNVWFWLLSIVSIIIIAVVSYGIYRMIHRPLSRLVVAFRHIEKGNLEVSVQHQSKDEFIYLYRQFNSTVYKLKQLIEEVYEQRYRLHLAELRQLQSQINPHFLYNSFYNLYRMARMEETEKVAHLTQNLGEYFYYITKSSDEVLFLEEVQNARAYVEIQSIRFEDHITVEFSDPPKGTEQLAVPKLILQPLIENCYKHGLEDLPRHGLIRIHMAVIGELLHIHLEDNGDPLSEEALIQLKGTLSESHMDAGGSGLTNVHRRLKLKFGDEGGLHLSRSELGGLKVTITIPLRSEPT